MQKRKQDAIISQKWTLADAAPLQYLVEPESLSGFLTNTWEKSPKLYKAQQDRQKLFPELCSLNFLKSLLHPKRGVQLEFGVDLNAARYKNGVRETPNAEVAGAETVVALYEEGCTVQLHQPQRWNKPMWRLIAAMERQLSCLVGANAYLTPAGTQGLAPHYDDVDLWVCQTEGKKRWRLYSNPEGYDLPATSSRDFEQDAIGKPVMDITLQVGDVLYMPRGTVHQAVAQGEASCHVTISTYQKWALADFVQVVIEELQHGQPASKGVDATPLLPSGLRTGLPIGFLATAGLQVDVKNSGRGTPSPVGTQAAQGLRELADRLEADPELTALAADRMAIDFMKWRAPPFPDHLPERGSLPTISSHVRSSGPGYFRLLPCQASREIQEAYSNETAFVRVLSCLKNRIETHMMGDQDLIEDSGEDSIPKEHATHTNGSASRTKQQAAKSDEEEDSAVEDESEEDDDESEDENSSELVFPASYTTALKQLLQAEAPLPVKELRLKSKEEKVGLAYSLWEEGIICTAKAGTESVNKKQKT